MKRSNNQKIRIDKILNIFDYKSIDEFIKHMLLELGLCPNDCPIGNLLEGKPCIECWRDWFSENLED